MEEETLLAAPHFYFGCCMVCRRGGAGIKRCSRCSVMFYCGAEHQKKHWKKHKPLCAYMATAAEEIGAETFFSRGLDIGDDDDEDAHRSEDPSANWTRFRVNAARMCEVLLARRLEEWEKEVFLFPRACRKCRTATKDGMVDCAGCMAVTYCSQQHMDEDAEHHRPSLCKELSFAMLCDNFECSISIAAPPMPSQLDKEFKVLSDMEQVVGPMASSQAQEMERRFLSDRLSGPLTILHAAQKYGLSSSGNAISTVEQLTVHVVGANVVEMLGIIKWEFIGHRLPACKDLRLVFIGLELESHGEDEDGVCPGLTACEDCIDQGKSVTYEVRPKSYEKYFNSGDYTKPDVVAVLNCGFHEFEAEEDKDTWRSSLPLLFSEAGVPVVFTSYTLTEAKRDLERVRRVVTQDAGRELSFDASCQENPFRSFRPIRDYEFSENKDVFYNNQYYSVARSVK